MMQFPKYLLLLGLLSLVSCVKYDLTDLTLNKSSYKMTVGESYKLIAVLSGIDDSNTKSWTSSNVAVATITDGGVVKAISKGTSTITLRIGQKTATCNITVEQVVPLAFTKGALYYYGDLNGTAQDAFPLVASNCFKVYLASDGINLTDLSGTGEFVILQINVPISVKDSIPTGTYNLENIQNNSGFIPYSITSGYIDNNSIQRGSWYFGLKTVPILLGNASVKASNNIYDINYELNDTSGLSLTGNFKGSLSYVDATTSATLSSVIKKNRYFLK